jgi:aminoglycoside phosphotransferase (APT) family kinase protein
MADNTGADSTGAGTGPAIEIVDEVHRSSRDREMVRVKLEQWLAGRLPSGADPKVPELTPTSATGMSSETLLFEASWAGHPSERLVARLAPDPVDVPVFPSYRMGNQFEAIRLVGEHSDVPVPPVRWYEDDPGVLGTTFFVMERVDGLVPPDIMPYPFGDNWLYDASPDQQRHLQESTLDVLARLHSIPDPAETFAFLAFDDPGDTALRRHVAHARAWYDYAARDGHRSPLVERGFAWLEDHWPTDEGAAVLSWGDSRIGNVMYRDFEPVAVLDWEMAGLGPREIDLGWMIYSHQCFQTMATGYGLPGMPDFFRPEDMASHYEALTGYVVKDLEWFITYAAVQWGVVGLITGLRAVHFGERELPDDIDDMLYNRASFEPRIT